ncbi:substrate-binding domain-containing protein [Nocardioides zeae]
MLLFDGNDPEDPSSGYDDLVRSTAVDAFVVTDTFKGSPQAAYLEDGGVPFVAFGRPWTPAALHPWVDVDGAAGTSAATAHLLAQGHTRVAWIGWRKDSPIGEDRRAGWSRTMHGHGLATTGLASRVEDCVASGVEAAGVLLDEAAPTAFVCASDTLATGVLHLLHERGLRPGRDVAVTGFDDSPLAQLLPGASPPCASRWRRSRCRWSTASASSSRTARCSAPAPSSSRRSWCGAAASAEVARPGRQNRRHHRLTA